MNLFEDLAKVYDANADKAGIVSEKNSVLFPLFHCGMNSQVTITIDMSGAFVKAEVNDPEEEFTVIPATLNSSCRTSDTSPHACNDRVDYLCGNMEKYYPMEEKDISRNRKRNEEYVQQLKAWSESPFAVPKIQAVYDYITGKTLLDDLVNAGILKLEDGSVNPKGKINKTAINTFAIRFSVMSEAEETPETWLDDEMFRSYIEYYTDVVNQTFEWDYCYVSGMYEPVTDKHSNGIRTNSDFAKLISSNESGLITYKNHYFRQSKDAMTIGYITSLKVHNALRWLISLQGLRNGENITLAWHDNGSPVKIPYYADTMIAYGIEEGITFANTSEYLTFMDNIASEMNEEDLSGNIHFLELDSSFKGDLKGRLAILDYEIFSAQDYYDSIFSWHKKYFWNIKGKRCFTGSPSVRDVILAAYGIEDSKNFLSMKSNSMYSMLYNRIIKCIIRKKEFPDDIIKQLYAHASTPMKYPHTHYRVLCIACAMINGKRGGGEIMLDREYTSRDYLFGRLLAIANYAERLTFKENEKGRETNAIRYMSDFANLPATSWERIYTKLQPYLRKLNRDKNTGEEFRRDINSVMDLFQPGDYNDEKLGSEYLLGYSSQSNALSKRDFARTKAAEEAKENI